MRRKLKSAEASANLMSELPFALTSPTTWKELGCMYTLAFLQLCQFDYTNVYLAELKPVGLQTAFSLM